MSRTEGRAALVTGASSGIGRATALELAAAGARLVVTARREDRLSALADEIEAKGWARPAVVSADLGVRGEAARLASAAHDAVGSIHILVNNAGGGVGGSIWAVGDRDEARTQFEVDLWSPLALIAEIVPEMRRRRDGTVVNVTSLRQIFSWPGMGHSSAANAALAIVTESLRLELMPFGVHVVDVVPGPVNTPSQGPTNLVPGVVDAIHSRFGVAEPNEVARLLVAAIDAREPYVFCPDSVVPAFEDPVAFRAEVREAVIQLLGDAPLDDAFLDEFVVGNDDPMLVEVRRQWEVDHGVLPR